MAVMTYAFEATFPAYNEFTYQPQVGTTKFTVKGVRHEDARTITTNDGGSFDVEEHIMCWLQTAGGEDYRLNLKLKPSSFSRINAFATACGCPIKRTAGGTSFDPNTWEGACIAVAFDTMDNGVIWAKSFAPVTPAPVADAPVAEWSSAQPGEVNTAQLGF